MKFTTLAIAIGLQLAAAGALAGESVATVNDGHASAERAPDRTDLKVRMKMAAMYISGAGVEQDIDRAIAIYEAAAAEDVAFAQYRLARIYLDGELLPPAPARAFDWLQRAARLGFVDAQLELSRLYAEGRGVDADDVEAHKWLNLAGSLGAVGTDERQAELEARMSFGDRVHARYLANKCKMNRYEDC
ncbi:MAG: tetratricopeptide repeat protein [Gammaproteobacteria bacterium]|nr:tetratricopeptide repeat protein [Gammaproteobacteria bacterium]